MLFAPRRAAVTLACQPPLPTAHPPTHHTHIRSRVCLPPAAAPLPRLTVGRLQVDCEAPEVRGRDAGPRGVVSTHRVQVEVAHHLGIFVDRAINVQIPAGIPKDPVGSSKRALTTLVSS